MKQFLIQLLGTSDFTGFAVLWTLALLGALMSLLYHASKRDPLDPRTPVAFSFNFLIIDNLRRLFINILGIFICIRFADQILGAEINPFLAFGIGASHDILIKLILSKIPKGDAGTNV